MNKKYICKWCMKLFKSENMASPNQCLLCYNNHWRTKTKLELFNHE